MEHADQVTQPITEKPMRGLATVAAVGMFFSLTTALYFFVIIPSQHPRELGALAFILPTLELAGVSALMSVVAALWTLGATVASGDRRASWTFGFFLLAVVFAAYALYQNAKYPNANPGHTWISAIYGFPAEDLSNHPIAFHGSLGLIATIAPIAFVYALTRGQVRRVSAAAGLPITLVIWIAMRIAG